MTLGVGLLELDVAQPCGFGEPPCAIDHRRGDVHPHHTPGHGQPGRVTRRLPGPAPDVQDVIAGPNPVASPQHHVVHPQFGIVVDAADLACPSRPGPFGISDRLRVVPVI